MTTMGHRCLPASILLLVLLTATLGGCAPVPTEPTLAPTATATFTNTPTDTVSRTAEATQTPWIITMLPEATATPETAASGLLFLSLPDGGYYHLFAYSPSRLPLTRLTGNAWDDITPSLGPDGNWLAFSSRQNGYWDLFLLNLLTGATMRLTDTREYEASPSWSPDGSWLAYEVYGEQSMEIAILSTLDATNKPIQLTRDTSLDCSPAWSPGGRQIAFVSDRSGEPEIWIADLDHASSDQFVNISQSSGTVESHPAWSPDGTRLAWSSADQATGLTYLWVWDAREPQKPAKLLTAGDWPAWWDNNLIATRISSPNLEQLTAYDSSSGLLAVPPIQLPGYMEGLGSGTSSAPFPGVFSSVNNLRPAPLYQTTLEGEALPGRTALVHLPGTLAAYSQLSDAADESFAALRARVGLETGWDVLANLENAYVPLSIPLDPGLQQDWLYTGRAFTLNPALVQSGWMVVIREDFGQQTWWRIFLRTTAQDGSQGRPLRFAPWDFSARTSSSQAFENGGRLASSVTNGYWVDLTSLAAEYGWERQPALTTWRTYYSGAHFNELAYTDGLDWKTAMLQLYPATALHTPTVVIPPTRTPTRTPLYFRSPTPTRTSTPRPTSTK